MNAWRLACLMILCAASLLPASAQGDVVPRFEPVQCPVDFITSHEVECGYVVVPEEHANPDSATIRVMLAIFRSYGDEVQPDPLIFLAGGPGNQTLKGFAGGAGGFFQRALRERDVIFLDQCGMGFSEPSLNCPEVDALYTFSVMGPLSADATLTVEAAQQCFDRLVNDGVNIAAFNTVESAADVADIAQALGYAQINIYGGSYGSTLAMTVMRNHPEIIRSVMLQGITPPQVDLMASFAPDYEHSLNMIFEACAANLNCSTAFPNLEDMFYAVVARFNREPLEIAVTNPLNQASTTLIMDGDYFIRGIQSGMYNSAFLPQLPYIIAAIYNEQYGIIDNMAVDYLERGSFSSEGALFAMRCMDDVLTTTTDTWETSVASVNPALQSAFRSDIAQWSALCTTWGARQLDPVENTPVVSDIPTLILNGAFDPVTPAAWGALAAETLSKSYNYTFQVSAHGVDPMTCPLDMFGEFINKPTAAPNADCLSYLPDITFITP